MVLPLGVAKAFECLKHAFTFAPILIHNGLANAFILEVDALDFAHWSVLSQTNDNW